MDCVAKNGMVSYSFHTDTVYYELIPIFHSIVSCEAYGRRWRLGDTVGVLVDMDLLEMRFYLNGEDLGPAFEDFSAYELHPAFSLNVRQCVRLNFGQYKFLHPPNEVDGKPFKPVVAALIAKYQQHQTQEAGGGNSAGIASPKPLLSPKKGASIATPSFSTLRNDDSPNNHPSQMVSNVINATSGGETSRQQQQQQIMNRILRPASSSLSGRPRPGSAMRPTVAQADTATTNVTVNTAEISSATARVPSSTVEVDAQAPSSTQLAIARSTNNEEITTENKESDTSIGAGSETESSAVEFADFGSINKFTVLLNE